MLKLARQNHQKSKTDSIVNILIYYELAELAYFQVNEEFLPFRNEVANLVVSPFFLHWTNDILRCFREVYRVLIPDGFFTGALFAVNTLKELREVLEKAEMSVEKKLSPHTSPLPTPGAVGDALSVKVYEQYDFQEVGFIITSVQSHPVTIEYRDIYQLMHHLQGMGENNCLIDRRHYISRKTLEEADRLYKVE